MLKSNNNSNILNSISEETYTSQVSFFWLSSEEACSLLKVEKDTLRKNCRKNESVEYSMLQFIDSPIDNGLIDAIKESVNAFIRTLIARGALIDGKCSYNADKNPPTEIANGHLTFDIEFMPPTPAERITFESFINIALLKNLAGQ